MGELVVTTFVTLDGVLQGPGAPDEDREDGFAHGGWQAPVFDEATGDRVQEEYDQADALLLGRRTYEIFAPYWSTAEDSPMTALINRIPKYVASRTLQGVDWTNTTLLEGEITDTIPRLKERHERVIVPGSGGLIQSLLRHELADRLHVWIHPVLLGTGKRLFADGTVPAALRLAGSETFGSGAVLLRYEHAGRPTYGSF